jgi:hypothetical protein
VEHGVRFQINGDEFFVTDALNKLLQLVSTANQMVGERWTMAHFFLLDPTGFFP